MHVAKLWVDSIFGSVEAHLDGHTCTKQDQSIYSN